MDDKERKCEFESCENAMPDHPSWVLIPVEEKVVHVCEYHAANCMVVRDEKGFHLELTQKHDWSDWWCNRLTTEERTDAIKQLFIDYQFAQSQDLANKAQADEAFTPASFSWKPPHPWYLLPKDVRNLVESYFAETEDPEASTEPEKPQQTDPTSEPEPKKRGPEFL